MKFVADECCDAGLVSLLRSEGHDVAYVSELNAGASDKEVLGKSLAEERILITEDRILGNLSIALGNPHMLWCYCDPMSVSVI